MSFTARTLAILHKDILTEWRTKERLSSMVFFVLLVLLVFNFSFELGGFALHEIGPGVLWSAYVFASLLGLNRTFATEQANNCLDGLLLAPGDRGAVYLGKMLGNMLFLLVIELLSLPFFALFFNLPVGDYLLPLLGILFLGAASLASVGTLFAIMSGNAHLRELLLPLLVLPMVMPALISCVEATAEIFKQSRVEMLFPHLQILGVYVVIFTTLSLLLFEYVVEE